MSNFLQRWVDESVENQKLYAREALMFDVTEDLLISMEDKGITKTQLANKLGKSKAQVSRTLGGMSNITLRTLSDFCFALDITPTVKILKEDRVISTPINFQSGIDIDNEWEILSPKLAANDSNMHITKVFNVGEQQHEYAQ